MTNPTNFFLFPATQNSEPVTCKSGNVYLPVNNIVTNVIPGDILDVINMGGRQVGASDAGAQLPQVASRFYNPVPGATPGTLLTVLSTIYAFPFRIPGNVNIQTICADVTTGQTGGQVRFGLYADLAGAPGALVAGSDSGAQVATGAAVITFTPASPLQLLEGWYWGALVAAATSTMPTVAAIAAGYAANLNAMIGQDTAAHAFATSAEAVSGVSAALTFAALPATFPTASFALNINAAVPLIVLGT